MSRTALVLGGGGVAGIAWQTGLLYGLAESGVDVTTSEWADMLLGTSAGATVAAQVTSGVPLAELFARQVDPDLQIDEPRPDVDIEDLNLLLERATERARGDQQHFARYVGAAALEASTPSEAERRAVIGDRLPSHDWPNRDLRVVAVDAESGRHRVLDRDSGVRLVDAVAASCAIPGMWPPVTIGVHRYVDGGVRSSENADLAAGFARVLILQVAAFGAGQDPLDQERERLIAGGSSVRVLRPDAQSQAAIGPDPTDPAVRTAAGESGYRQGGAVGDSIKAFDRG